MGFESDSVNTRIRADAASEVFQSRQHTHIFSRVVDGYRSDGASERESLLESIDSDHAGSTQQEGTRDCELSHGSTAPDGDGVVFLNLCILGRHVPPRKKIIREKTTYFLA